MDTASSMSLMPSTEEMTHLRNLVPLHTLPDEALSELLEDAGFESIAKGKVLFEQGDTNHENVYLLDGTVQLLSEGSVIETVTAGSDTARFPLAHQLPRKFSARAKNKLRIARLDSRRLSELLARTQTVDYQVADLDEASEDDWMSMLLQSRVLQQVPASNIQRVMMNVEQLEVPKGKDLIRQGDPGDFYYMLTRGRAVVRRDSGDGNGLSELATLGPGDAFGEEALLSDNPRNSTITMLQDGHVLRLGKEQFLELIHNPLLDKVDMKAAQVKVDQGALWLDLRSSEQYDQEHLPGAINFPFESLRYQASSLAPDRHYVLYSNSGGRAMAGAFLLTERGFDVSVLDGGMQQGTPESGGAKVAVTQPSVKVSSAEPPVSDQAADERIREAELRAKELEERLREVQRGHETAVEERQQHLQQVRATVDQARRKVLETEQQKREALEERQKAYADMERLTSNLEAIENERASLVDRMSEIEGLDKQLQNRLAKAERDLIVERERAESAGNSLEDLSERLSEAIEQRELERQQHDLERGELKEELTELRMEFEQAKLDLEEAQQAVAAAQPTADEVEALGKLQQRLQEIDSENEALRQELDKSNELVDSQRQQLDSGASEHDAALAEAREQSEEAAKALESTRQELDQVNRVAADLEASLEQQRSLLQETQDKAAADIASSHAESERLNEESQRQITQLKHDNDQLQEQISAGSQEAGTAVAQAQARTAELEEKLEKQQTEAAQQIGQKQEAMDTALASAADEADKLRASNEALTQQLATLRDESDAATQESQARLEEVERVSDEREQALTAAQNEAQERQQRLDALQAEYQSLQDKLAAGDSDAKAAVEQAQANQAAIEEQLCEKTQQLESKDAELADLRSELDQLQQRSEQNETLRSELETLRATAAQQAEQTTGSEQLLAQLRDETREQAQKLEERDNALSAARSEQAELIEALNAASAERETLQFAISEKDDEQARLVDLENQVAEAIRKHESEQLLHEKQQRDLREQIDVEKTRRHALQDEVERLQVELADGTNDTSDAELRAERDKLIADLAVRDREVEKLRGVLEEYVDQIRGAQGGGEDEVAALRTELEMVREQAIRDVAHMREQLAAVEMQKRRMQEADGREAISLESMRQRIEELETTLNERQRDLTEAEASRHMLEDSLEDVNRQLDELKRELEKTQVEVDEAVSSRREAESARDQLQQALYEIQENAEDAKVTDLRDDRMAFNSRPLGMDSVAPPPRRGLAALIGAGVVLGALQALSFLTGNGELFTALLRLSGQ